MHSDRLRNVLKRQPFTESVPQEFLCLSKPARWLTPDIICPETTRRLADYLEHDPLDYKDRCLVHQQELFIEPPSQQLDIFARQIYRVVLNTKVFANALQPWRLNLDDERAPAAVVKILRVEFPRWMEKQ